MEFNVIVKQFGKGNSDIKHNSDLNTVSFFCLTPHAPRVLAVCIDVTCYYSFPGMGKKSHRSGVRNIVRLFLYVAIVTSYSRAMWRQKSWPAGTWRHIARGLLVATAAHVRCSQNILRIIGLQFSIRVPIKGFIVITTDKLTLTKGMST